MSIASKCLFAGAAAVSAAIFSFAASAAPIGPVTVGAEADAYIHGTDVDNNYGTATDLQLKANRRNTPGSARKVYLRFDLGSLEDTIQDATLNLFNSGSGGRTLDGKVWTFNVYGLTGDGGDWSETDVNGITWNNAPGHDTALGNGVLESQTTFLGSYQIVEEGSVGERYIITGEGLVQFLNARRNDNGLATIIITRETLEDFDNAPDDGIWHWLGGRDHANAELRPSLEMTFVPEPAGLGLVAAGLLLLARRGVRTRGN